MIIKRILLLIISLLLSNLIHAQIKEDTTCWDRSYISTLDSLLKEDQRVRGNKYIKASRYYHKYKSNPIKKKKNKFKKCERIHNDWIRTDSSNINFLLELISIKGFPSKKIVGLRGYQNAWIIFLHFDTDSTNLILQPILDTALEKKEIATIQYATIIDRHRVNNGQKPLYYAWDICDFFDLSDEEKQIILENRKNIGLERSSVKCGFKQYQFIE